MSKNIVKSWKTTIVGAVILAACLASLFLLEKVEWSDLTIPLVIGVCLLFSPDTLIQKIMGTTPTDITNKQPRNEEPIDT